MQLQIRRSKVINLFYISYKILLNSTGNKNLRKDSVLLILLNSNIIAIAKY